MTFRRHCHRNRLRQQRLAHLPPGTSHVRIPPRHAVILEIPAGLEAAIRFRPRLHLGEPGSAATIHILAAPLADPARGRHPEHEAIAAVEHLVEAALDILAEPDPDQRAAAPAAILDRQLVSPTVSGVAPRVAHTFLDDLDPEARDALIAPDRHQIRQRAIHRHGVYLTHLHRWVRDHVDIRANRAAYRETRHTPQPNPAQPPAPLHPDALEAAHDPVHRRPPAPAPPATPIDAYAGCDA